jgi:hypothetical protein
MADQSSITPGAPETQGFSDFTIDPSLGQSIPNPGPIPQSQGPPTTGVPFNDPTSGFNQQQFAKAPDVFASLLKLTPTIQLTTEGQEYVKNFLATILDDHFLIKNLKAIYINQPQKAILITHGAHAGFLILFEETLNTVIDDQIVDYNIYQNNQMRNIPIARVAITAAIKCVLQMGFNVTALDQFNLLGIEIIRQRDYANNRFMKLADRIRSVFHLNSLTSNPFTAPIRYSDILTGSTVNIFTDIRDIQNSMDIISPHETKPRVDFGCRVVINYPTTQPTYGQSNKAALELGTIGGYAQFIEDVTTNIYSPQAVSPKYTPVIHITDISTVFSTPSLLGLLITTFYETFCVNRQYQKAYFDLALDNNSRNIQYLFPQDAEGRVIPGLDTIEGRQHILNSPHFNLPLLVLDLTEGSYIISSLQHNDFVSINNFIKYHMCSSLNVPYIVPDIFDRYWEEYTGVITSSSGKALDSRYASDFLSAIDTTKDYAKCKGLLSIYQNPVDKVNILKNIYQDYFTVQHVTSIYKVNINWLIEVRNILRSMVVIDQNNINLFEGAHILDLSADISNYAQMYGNIANSFVPYQQNRSMYGNFNNYSYYPHIQPMAQPQTGYGQATPQFQSNL